MTSDPDAEWYENSGLRPDSRPRSQSLQNESFWRVIEPLYDLLHEQYRVAWTYSVLMLQASEDFKGTDLNLGVGDHFSAREEVIFSQGVGSPVRAGWHANQLPPFLVQQSLNMTAPFELISTYALNVRFLTDAIPFAITREPEDDEPNATNTRVVSVAPFYEVFENDVRALTQIVEAADVHYTSAGRWADGGIAKLRPTFAELDKRLSATLHSDRARRILKVSEGNLYTMVRAGPDPEVVGKLKARLGRPKGSNLALAKYLVLMNAVWPEWRRITMVPHPVPVLSHPQPGGIVICEDNRSQKLTVADTKKIADLASIAIWPWVSLQEGARRAEEATRNAALLGEVVRHDLSNALLPVRALLSERTYRTSLVTDSECAEYSSGLDVLYWSIVGLCGLDDAPASPERIAFETMFENLRMAFSGNPNAQFVIDSGGDLQTRLPRLYYPVFAELILNAGKRRPPDWSDDRPHIIITARQDEGDLLITVANAAEARHVEKAASRLRESLAELSDRSRPIGSKRYRKGLGLVANLVVHARGHLACRTHTDAQANHWLTTLVRIP